MKQQAQIRLAVPGDLAAVSELLEAGLPNLVQDDVKAASLGRRLHDLIADGCLIVAQIEQRYAAVLALDLMQQQLIAGHLNPALLDKAAPRRLIAAVETRALRFGLRSLTCTVQPAALRFMFSLGYDLSPESVDAAGPFPVCKSLQAGAETWVRKIFALHRELGIPESYGAQHRLTLIEDCQNLESIGFDIYDREQWLHPVAAAAWRKMHDSAATSGIDLQVVSAFRSRDYQAGLIRAKLAKGLDMKQILRVSAAPGFSQHHSGRALDLKAPGSSALEEEFATTAAYRWLSANARFFGFKETLGKNNRHGIIWEPWHWYYGGEAGIS